MASRTLTVTKVDHMDVNYLNASVDILDEPICMDSNIGFMPVMNEVYSEYKIESITSEEAVEGFTNVEEDLVKYLYQIRAANRNSGKESGGILYWDYFRKGERTRIFIAGKIFPVLRIDTELGSSIDCDSKKIQLLGITQEELYKELGAKSYVDKIYVKNTYSCSYIYIDGKIKIYVPFFNPKMGINYPELMLDFLKNGKKTQVVSSYGEFPSLEHYVLATGEKDLGKGCWLKEDRGKEVWKNACMYIVKHKLKGILGPFGQIGEFYDFLDKKIMKETKHKTRWLKGAKNLVSSLEMLDAKLARGFVNDYIEVVLMELNVGICDYAITQFYELFFGKYKNDPRDNSFASEGDKEKGFSKAYIFDRDFVIHEQGVIAIPIYEKYKTLYPDVLEEYQKMADPDGKINRIIAARYKVLPPFKDWNAKVTDTQFRIDLPLLMLWLDIHQPTDKAFKGKVYEEDTEDKIDEKKRKVFKNTLKEEWRKKIREYEIKS